MPYEDDQERYRLSIEGHDPRQGASRRQRKGSFKRYTTGGTKEQRLGTLGHNLKSYANAGKLREIYAATIFLGALPEGEEDPTKFWELVAAIRQAGGFKPEQTNQFIYDTWIGDPYSWGIIHSIIEGMEEGAGLEAVEFVTHGLRGGQTVITTSGRSPEEEEKRLKVLKHMLDKGYINQETYVRRVGGISGAGTTTKDYERRLGKQVGADAPTKSEATWDPSGPGREGV